MRWLLLISTFIMLFITYEAFVFCGILKDADYSQILKGFGKSGTNSSLKAQNEAKNYYRINYITSVPFAFLAGTVFIVIETYKAFFS